ncbi:hypothetical protein Y788_09780 [Pantoea dispersa 625]|nr:hypothetical protein Y788_09780 [Pantoea dispersa 625]
MPLSVYNMAIICELSHCYPVSGADIQWFTACKEYETIRLFKFSFEVVQ